jgi:hypothetical protein
MFIRIVSLMLALYSTSLAAEKYIIGAQNIQYLPHYDFSSPVNKGVGWAILEAFSQQSGHEFVYLSMPIRRLQMELLKGHVDFVYPDNPNWYNQVTKAEDKSFSLPLTHAITGTLVKQQNSGKGIDAIKRIVMPLGFTPVNWQTRIDKKLTEIVWTSDIYAGLSMLQKGRVDAMDLEVHVSNYYSQHTLDFDSFVLDLTLPHNDVPFMLSTLQHQSILDELNQFIKSNPQKIREIKQAYGIINYGDLKPILMKQQDIDEIDIWRTPPATPLR